MPQEERALRPARALLGWLSDKQARGTLNGQRRDAELTDEQRRAVEQARAQVAAREPFRVVPAVVAPCPDVLREHRMALLAEERFGAMRNEGWDIAIVDLERVCVVQPTVLSDPDPRVEEGLDPGDLAALAKITLPIVNAEALPYQIDSTKNVAMLSSPNPNLRVVGFRVQQIGQGSLIGFVVEIASSYVQVAEFGGRFVLRDGNHRAVSLFRKGITRVPALTRKFMHGENLGLGKSVLSPTTYLGERPPQVGDYWNPAVSAAISVPRTRKLVLIQGIEQGLADAP
jgi:hypothetical protein